jgi:hypothetical protein
MTQVEQLNTKLQEHGLTVRSVFPGTNPNVTDEQVAAELSRAIDSLMAGNFEEVSIEND